MDKPAARLYDVIARDLSSGGERVIRSGLTESQAEAVVMISVMRRGVEAECFFSRPTRTQGEQ